jgi:cation diffusion facilitator CzcD-associated flavoprotein CzcO
MSEASTLNRGQTNAVEHFECLILGAGVSGIGGAYHLIKQCPEMSFVVLDAQETFGGTWVTHRYPGIRSDSDLYTYGYSFKPWTGAPIATSAEIRNYMNEVITENGIADRIATGIGSHRRSGPAR